MRKLIIQIVTLAVLTLSATTTGLHAQKGVSLNGETEDVWASYRHKVWSAVPFVTENGSLVPWPRLARSGERLRYAPLVTTDSVCGVSATTARFAGRLWHHGWCQPISVCGFQVATDSSFTQDTVRVSHSHPLFLSFENCVPPCPANAYADSLLGLAPGTTFYVRAFARNDCGENYGETLSFVTPNLVVSLASSDSSTVLICDAEPLKTVTYTLNVIPAGDYVYQWSVTNNNGNLFSVNDNVLTMTFSNEVVDCRIYCSIIYNDKVLNDSILVNVIKDLPMDYLLCDEGSDGSVQVLSKTNVATVEWKNAGGAVVGTDDILTGNPGEAYFLTLTSAKGCRLHDTVTIADAPTYCTVANARAGSEKNGKWINKEWTYDDDNTRIVAVSDHEGNVYDVVQIGGQCWLKQNMRAVTSPTTGTGFINGTTLTTYSGKTAIWSMFDSTLAVEKHYGVMYNWNAAMDLYNQSKGELSISGTASDAVSLVVSSAHRGICPEGWHVPTANEYLTMETVALELQEGHPAPNPTLETQNKFRAANTALAAILSGGCDWCTSAKTNAPGSYNNPWRNASGFSAYPAEADYPEECGGAHFWTATQSSASQAACVSLYNNVEGVNWYIRDPKTYCLSLRCVRDAE